MGSKMIQNKEKQTLIDLRLGRLFDLGRVDCNKNVKLKIAPKSWLEIPKFISALSMQN